MQLERLEATDLVDKACAQLGYNLSALIALVSIWIDPTVVEMLAPVAGVWYPRHRRANLGLRIEGNSVEHVGHMVDGITLDNNTYANTCFKRALGIHRKQMIGFYVCHIWPGTAYDPRCFTACESCCDHKRAGAINRPPSPHCRLSQVSILGTLSLEARQGTVAGRTRQLSQDMASAFLIKRRSPRIH
jgi:hypothetical protein